MKRSAKYWISQFCGWGLYAVLSLIVNRLSGNHYSMPLFMTLFSVVAIGILTTHVFRFFIKRSGWINLSIPQLIPRVLPSIIVFSFAFHLIHSVLLWGILGDNPMDTQPELHLQRILVWAMLLLIWSLIYFGFHFFENFRMEEIKYLKSETARMETELNNLRAQINPHFLFNALNTIRALITEDPDKARDSVMQLSNILRNTLNAGKLPVISFKEELALIKDYLALEKTRYEKRLNVKINTEPESVNYYVPPLMIQTLVENGIKHGISKLAEGGEINIESKTDNGFLHIKITNSGQYQMKKSQNGIGINNTKKRLSMIYGDKAMFYIGNKDENTVITEIALPLQNNTDD